MVLILLVGLLGKTTDIVQRKASDYKYNPFFEHTEDFDVIFMGSSHVINAIFPMELWNDYGITSYNFGGHGNHLATTYWVLRNSLDYTKPKVVVIDCLALGSMQKTSDNFSNVHLSFDAFPLSITKIKGVEDLLNDPEIDRKINEGIITETEKRTKIGLLWDYSVYHTRWEKLGIEDFEVSSTVEYGAESRIQISYPGKIVENSGAKLTEETVGVIYLRKMIEECQNKDIEVILTYLPYPVGNETIWMDVNMVYDIAKEYGVPYINFLEEEIVDYNTDCYDDASHLNPSGGWKVTNYLGEYLQNNYNLIDHRGDKDYSYWDEDYEAYENYKDTRFASVSDLNTFLMLLEDDNYGFVMNIGDSTIFNDSITINLLKNKGIDVAKINEETKYIIVCGNDVEVINSDINVDGTYKDLKELLVLNSNTLSVLEGRISITVFDIDEKHRIVDYSEFGIPRAIEMDERYPNQYGVIVLSSKATRLENSNAHHFISE